MYQLLFRNRWIAFLWAGATLASIGAFVSDGGGTDRLDETAQEVREQRRIMSGEPGPIVIDEAPLLDDAALIDPASGYDPTPVEERDAGPTIVDSGLIEQPAEDY